MRATLVRSTLGAPLRAPPRATLRPTLVPRRFSSDVERLKSETGANDSDESAEVTGVMDYAKSKEVLIFFDNIHPRWLYKLASVRYIGPMFKLWQKSFDDDKLRARLSGLIDNTQHPLPAEAKTVAFVPLRRDGGAFVKFLVPPNSSSRDLSAKIESNILESKADRTHWSLLNWVLPFPRALLVKGTPWIEDLSRFPLYKLKVIFEGELLTEEKLYLLFRRYGQIVDIVPATKDVAYATVIFARTDSCIRAKNCVTGMCLNDNRTTLHLQYIPVRRVNHLTSFVSNHQRIAIPVILALLATVAVLIFEPIRAQCIELKIKHYYSWDHWLVKLLYAPYRFLSASLSDGRHFLDDSLTSIRGAKKETVDVQDMEQDIFWAERSEKANQLRLWVCENANTFIIVKGPRGLGKREFVVDHALSDNPDFSRKMLEIDCGTLLKLRSDKAFLKAAAGQVGYFPLFTWTNLVSQFVDLGLQGLTGQKLGLSESKETQYKNMLQLTAVAIRKVALEDYPAYKCEFQRQQKRKLAEQGADGVLDSKLSEVREEDYLQLHPEVKPVVVIDNFLRKADNENDFIFKTLADWAGQLVQSNTAHVIFITLDSGSTLHLTAALPSLVFKTISLNDASLASAKQYVQRQLRGTKSADIDSCLDPIGGRMLDLQAFVRRVKSGEDPDAALHEMIHQAAEQVSAFFLNVTNASKDNDVTWTTAQIWGLMRLLAEKDSVGIDELIKSPLFASNLDTAATLSVLEKNDLISLYRDKGMIKTISTGRPLFRAAFKDLVNDPKVFKLYESYFYSELIKVENAKIAKLEDEICKISGMSDIRSIKDRAEYLSKKISASTDKVQGYEAKVKELDALGTQQKSGSFFSFS